jgi:acyl carrier protein
MEVRDTIRDLMTALGKPLDAGWPGERPLDLESIEVIMLHDALEQALDVRIPAALVTPDAFATLDTLTALVGEARAASPSRPRTPGEVWP